jgi:hypothetical protein
MRISTLALLGALGLAASVASANAAPLVPATAAPEGSNIVQVAGGCGNGLHRNSRGFCVRSRHHYRPYAAYRSHRYYGANRYYGGGYSPWYGPSPNDHVANQLNARELGRLHYGY